MLTREIRNPRRIRVRAAILAIRTTRMPLRNLLAIKPGIGLASRVGALIYLSPRTVDR